MSANLAPRNRLLCSLSPSTFKRISEDLDYLDVPHGKVIADRGEIMEFVYFPDAGMISVIASARGGQIVEVGTIGKEGFCGINTALGVDKSDRQKMGQVDGYGWRMKAEAFRRYLKEDEEFTALTNRFILTFLHHSAQTSLCNRLHKIEQRCARWLLLTHDRSDGDTVDLIQEFIAMMLGVRRAGVNSALGYLVDTGALRLSRGVITVINRRRLEELSCPCYQEFNEFFNETMGFSFQQTSL